MTALETAATAIDAAWTACQEAEAAARAGYANSVQEAQRNFDADVKPAIDTYHSVERAAWQAYTMTKRAARRRYLDVVTAATGKPVTTPPPQADPATGPLPAPTALIPAVQPTFTPVPESRS